MTNRERADLVLEVCEKHICGSAKNPIDHDGIKYAACLRCIKAALDEARDLALEQAAVIADAEVAVWSRPGGHTASDGVAFAASKAIARQIRSLKGHRKKGDR